MFETKVVEKTKTHILCPVSFFLENFAFYRIIWKYIVDPDRRMLIACCILKATSTHSEYAIFISFPLQQWLHERT